MSTSPSVSLRRKLRRSDRSACHPCSRAPKGLPALLAPDALALAITPMPTMPGIEERAGTGPPSLARRASVLVKKANKIRGFERRLSIRRVRVLHFATRVCKNGYTPETLSQ